MNKKGFTLTELLVVIAIIGVLSVIIIPSVVKINENINVREYEQRKTYIQNAAEIYASDKPGIFTDGDVAYVYVWQLVTENYLNVDVGGSDDVCKYYTEGDVTSLIEDSTDVNIKNSVLSAGCVSDPVHQSSLNSKLVKLTKKTVGVVAELQDDRTVIKQDGGGDYLVKKVCTAIKEGQVLGKYGEGQDQTCECVISNGDVTNLVKPGTGTEVQSCILVSTSDSNGNVNNWLKYGSSTANWRVVGLYKVNNQIVAKIITSSVVD